MFSFVGETVLDPYLGSGTTTKVAKELKRNSVGYEINKDYLPVIKQKVGINKKSLFDKGNKFEIICQNRAIGQKREIKEVNKLITSKAVISNRISHPDYWKTLKESRDLKIVNI